MPALGRFKADRHGLGSRRAGGGHEPGARESGVRGQEDGTHPSPKRKRGSSGYCPPILLRRLLRAKLVGELANLLVVLPAVGLPRLLSLAIVLLLSVEGQLALD